jgi:hypothetical protein
MSNEKIKASYAPKNPDRKESLDEKTKSEIIPEHLKSDGNNSNSHDLAKVLPAISALSKYCEPPKSSEPSKSNETDYEAKFQDLRDRHSKQPEQKSEPSEDNKY